MLFAYGKIFSHGRIKSGRKSSIKKKKKQTNREKTGSKKRERIPFCCEVRDANKIYK